MPIMRFQFSLATLLVCMTVLAVVCGLAAIIPVHEPFPLGLEKNYAGKLIVIWEGDGYLSRRPIANEITWRIATWGSESVTAALIMLAVVGISKSRRHAESPVK
jgi:hypothetical protein